MTKILTLCLLISTSGFGQTATTSDSLINVPKEKKSPQGAMLRSALIPGWGQLYNEEYLKVPVMFGVFAGIGFVANWYHLKYDDYKGRYISSSQRLENEPALSANSIFMREHNFNKTAREFYRDNRDTYLFYLVLAYFMNIVDAYVDAQLFGFDVDGPLSAQLNQLKTKDLSSVSWRKPDQTLLSLTFNF